MDSSLALGMADERLGTTSEFVILNEAKRREESTMDFSLALGMTRNARNNSQQLTTNFLTLNLLEQCENL